MHVKVWRTQSTNNSMTKLLRENDMVIKSRQGKPTRNRALILSVSKIPIGNMKGGQTITTNSLFDSQVLWDTSTVGIYSHHPPQVLKRKPFTGEVTHPSALDTTWTLVSGLVHITHKHSNILLHVNGNVHNEVESLRPIADEGSIAGQTLHILTLSKRGFVFSPAKNWK